MLTRDVGISRIRYIHTTDIFLLFVTFAECYLYEKFLLIVQKLIYFDFKPSSPSPATIQNSETVNFWKNKRQSKQNIVEIFFS